jgi:hypothetical protein
MLARGIKASSWITVAGVVVLLIGLGWDAVLHRLDPELAEKEGVFTLSNPGHVLFGAGIAIVTLGVALFLLGRLSADPALPRFQRFARTLPIAALAVLFGLSFSLAMTSDGGLASGHQHEHTTAADHEHNDIAAHDHAASDDHDLADEEAAQPTEEEQQAVDTLVAETKAETVRFADFAVAEAEGYVQVTPYNRGSWGAAHFHNQTYATDGVLLDPAKPEDLIYLKLQDGQMVLLGVMYLAPAGEGPEVGGPLTDWHTHDNLCIAPGAKIRPRIDGQCIGGGVPVTQEMMHVWTFDHPRGPLAHDLGPDGLRAALAQFAAPPDQSSLGDDTATTATPTL